MATRIDDILIGARDSLADPQGIRWTDERLLRLINEAQETIALDARLLRKTSEGTIVSGTPEYTVPLDCAVVLRLSINAERVPELTYEDLEGEWEDTTSAYVEGVIFDKSNADKFRLYPIPASPVYTTYKLYYQAVPTKVSKITDSLEIPKVFDKALKHYTIGMALRDDQDTQSRATGNEELQLYTIELSKAMRLSGVNFSKNSSRTTQYRGFE
jgi:hypothetical protein